MYTFVLYFRCLTLWFCSVLFFIYYCYILSPFLLFIVCHEGGNVHQPGEEFICSDRCNLWLVVWFIFQSGHSAHYYLFTLLVYGLTLVWVPCWQDPKVNSDCLPVEWPLWAVNKSLFCTDPWYIQVGVVKPSPRKDDTQHTWNVGTVWKYRNKKIVICG